MLVLTRKLEERIQIGDDITITILKVKGNSVRVGIEAPPHVRVMRTELSEKIAAAVSGEINAALPTEPVRPNQSMLEIAPPLAPAMSSLRELLARRQMLPQAKRQTNA